MWQTSKPGFFCLTHIFLASHNFRYFVSISRTLCWNYLILPLVKYTTTRNAGNNLTKIERIVTHQQWKNLFSTIFTWRDLMTKIYNSYIIVWERSPLFNGTELCALITALCEVIISFSMSLVLAPCCILTEHLSLQKHNDILYFLNESKTNTYACFCDVLFGSM